MSPPIATVQDQSCVLGKLLGHLFLGGASGTQWVYFGMPASTGLSDTHVMHVGLHFAAILIAFLSRDISKDAAWGISQMNNNGCPLQSPNHHWLTGAETVREREVDANSFVLHLNPPLTLENSNKGAKRESRSEIL